MTQDENGTAMIPLGSRANAWGVSRDRVDLVRAARPSRPVTLSTTPQAVTFDLASTALVIVDMQNDFCHPDGWLAHIGVDVAPARRPIEPIRALLDPLRAHDVPIIWLNWGNRPDRLNLSPSLLHVYNATGAGVGLGDPLPGSGAHVLEKGSWAAAIVDELPIGAGDIRVDKYRMSGFWDTPLDAILRNLRVSTVLFAGINADQCVLHTLADANFLGYDTIFLEDCCATTSPAFCWDATLYNVRQIFGFVADGGELVTALGALPPRATTA
jgi:nicotinamidase-related amidase